MKISPPCIITSRLMAGIKIGNGTISIDYSKRRADENRIRYQYYIDIPDCPEFTADDIQSGNPVANSPRGLQQGLESILAFLGACAESYGYKLRTGREGENLDLFPQHIAEWAYQYSDEISIAQLELEETPNIIHESFSPSYGGDMPYGC